MWLKKILSSILVFFSYNLLFFALWSYAHYSFAPWHSSFLAPINLTSLPTNDWQWPTYWMSYFFDGMGSYLFAGFSLFLGIRLIFTAYRRHNYFRIWFVNLSFICAIAGGFWISQILNYLLIPKDFWQSYLSAIFPLIAYLLSMKFWLTMHNHIFENTEKAKRSDVKAQNDLNHFENDLEAAIEMEEDEEEYQFRRRRLSEKPPF